MAAIALILRGRRREPAGGFDGRALRVRSRPAGSRVLLLAFTVFLLGGLLMSASRAGFAAEYRRRSGARLAADARALARAADLVRWFWIGMAIVLVFAVIAGSALLARRCAPTTPQPHRDLADLARRHPPVAVVWMGPGQLRRHLHHPAAGLDEPGPVALLISTSASRSAASLPGTRFHNRAGSVTSSSNQVRCARLKWPAV